MEQACLSQTAAAAGATPAARVPETTRDSPLTNPRVPRRHSRLELQVESMSSFAVRVFLYTWYAVLLAGLAVQAYNVSLQWEARELCGAERVSLDALAAWNSSPCMQTQSYWTHADTHLLHAGTSFHSPPAAPTWLGRSDHARATSAFFWLEAPAQRDLFPPSKPLSPPPSGLSSFASSSSSALNDAQEPDADDVESMVHALARARTSHTPAFARAPTTTSTTTVPRPTMRPLVKRFAVRWTSATSFAHLMDRRMNRFTHVLLSLASPMTNITEPHHRGKERDAPRYRTYFLRVALEEEALDPSPDDSSSAGGGADSNARSGTVSGHVWSPSPTASRLFSSASASSTADDSDSADSGTARWHYVMNTTVTCYVDRPRCDTLVLPRSVAVVTERNASRLSLTLLDVEPELALAATNPSAIGVWYQRELYTLGTLVWRCVFFTYTVLSCCRFLSRSRSQRRDGRHHVAWLREHYGLLLLQVSFLGYLDPLFVPGVYEWTGVPVSVYHFLEFHFPNYFVATLLCFCFVTSMSCGQAPPESCESPRHADSAPGALSARQVGAEGSSQPLPLWVSLTTGGYLVAVFIIDISQGFFEDWAWGAEAVCDDQICHSLRVALDVVLLAGFVVVFITVWWLPGRLAALPYLETRRQQLVGRLFSFVLSGCFLYVVASTVIVWALHAQVLALVYFQPLTQLGPMVVTTVLVNHLTYLLTPIGTSSRVPIRPSDATWKRVRWSSRWFRWLDMHGGSLYIFATEEEERAFMALQRQLPSPSGRRHRQRHSSRQRAEVRRARSSGSASAETPASGEPRGRPPGTPVADSTHTSHRASAYTSHVTSTVASSSRSSSTASSNTQRSAALAAPTASSVSAAAASAGSSPHEEFNRAVSPVDDTHRLGASQSARARIGRVTEEGGGENLPRSRRAGLHTGTGAVLSLLHGAEQTFVSGTGQLMDTLEDTFLERPLYAVLHGSRRDDTARGNESGFGGPASSRAEAKVLAQAESRRHYFFNTETAVDCFNMAWEAYAVTSSQGDALIETGLSVDPSVAPEAMLSGVSRFVHWLFTHLFAWKQHLDEQRGQSRSLARDDSVTVAVLDTALTTPDASAGAVHTPPRSANSRTVPDPSDFPSPPTRVLNPGLYGHRLLAVIEEAGVQVIVTTPDGRVAAHAGKTARLVVSFRGTDNVSNAVQDFRFHQRAWREMPDRLLSVRPTVHSGFLEIWMQLKARVLNAVLNALRETYVFDPFCKAPTAAAVPPPLRADGTRTGESPAWRLRHSTPEPQNRGEDRQASEPPRPALSATAVPPEGPGAFADVFITGHSLGGALACLCAYSLHRALLLVHYPRPDVCVYSFGQPRIGNVSFRDAYNAAVPRTFRVVNESDAVSGWRLWSGHHVGVQVNIDRRGNFLCKPTPIERLLRPTSGPGLAVLNHAMLAYADSLNAVADRVQGQSTAWDESEHTRVELSCDDAQRGPSAPLRCLVPCPRPADDDDDD